jgi:hypothetical protein
MNYPERSSRPDDYIDRVGDGVAWTPIVLLGIAFIAVLGLLLFVPSRQSSKTTNNQHSELIAPAPSSQSAVFPNPK